ncbi:MAG: diadenylate cyclase CdaA [Bacteroidales bacterium]|nr:diadenylate cyclase CdaA [Bacteroidales bacterium]
MGILDFGFIDLIDILLSAYLMYIVYIKLHGTKAVNILIAIFMINVMYLIVRLLGMSLLSTIMSKILSVGLLALVIVFQQEIRKFLLEVGDKSSISKFFSVERIFRNVIKESPENLNIPEIVKACTEFAKDNTGALIVLPSHSNIDSIIKTGEHLDCAITARLLGSLFFKNSPLHDGAVIISKGRIVAAKCILPLTDNPDVPQNIGTRHRSAIGMSEVSDCLVVVVSEERGEISYCEYGAICQDVTPTQLTDKLRERFSIADYDPETVKEGLLGKVYNWFRG